MCHYSVYAGFFLDTILNINTLLWFGFCCVTLAFLHPVSCNLLVTTTIELQPPRRGEEVRPQVNRVDWITLAYHRCLHEQQPSAVYDISAFCDSHLHCLHVIVTASSNNKLAELHQLHQLELSCK